MTSRDTFMSGIVPGFWSTIQSPHSTDHSAVGSGAGAGMQIPALQSAGQGN